MQFIWMEFNGFNEFCIEISIEFIWMEFNGFNKLLCREIHGIHLDGIQRVQWIWGARREFTPLPSLNAHYNALRAWSFFASLLSSTTLYITLHYKHYNVLRAWSFFVIHYITMRYVRGAALLSITLDYIKMRCVRGASLFSITLNYITMRCMRGASLLSSITFLHYIIYITLQFAASMELLCYPAPLFSLSGLYTSGVVTNVHSNAKLTAFVLVNCAFEFCILYFISCISIPLHSHAL